ncbi:TonB-dependent receptor plug domain-containing protein [Pseudomonadota bacterium]
MQNEIPLARDWEITAGIRHDRYSNFGSTVNPRIAVVWATSYNPTSKLLYGSAFLPPTFNQLYAQTNPSMLGNPNLEASTIKTLELAFEHHPNFDLHNGFNIYRYESRDLIAFIHSQAQNTGAQTGYGLEAGTTWTPSNQWDIKANIALQRAYNEKPKQPTADVPVPIPDIKLMITHSRTWLFINNGTNSLNPK